MPKRMIPLNTDPYQNVDEDEVRETQAAVLKNAYVNELKHTKVRPGLSEKWDLSTDVTDPTYYTSVPADGMFWWETVKVLVIAAGGNLYAIDSPHAAPRRISAPGTFTNLAQGTPVVFTDAGEYASRKYMMGANGTGLFHVGRFDDVAAGPGDLLRCADVGDADAPQHGTHVGYLDGYTLSNNNNDEFQWSDAGDPFNWNALSFATAEASTDKIMSLLVNWREILLVGENTVEVWYNSGMTAPFRKLLGAAIELGTSARYTAKEYNDTWGWLDNHRRLIELNQRTPQVISGPIDKVIQGFTDVSDATSDVLEVGGRHWLIVTFPTARRTFAYEYAMKTWSEWSTWDNDGAIDQEWRARHFVHVPDWGLHLAADRLSSKIFDVSPDYHDDNGDNIRVIRRTGNITHDTHQKKRSNSLVIRLKRGVGDVAGSEPTMSVRWRSDNKAWGKEREVSLGKIGDTYAFATLRGLGMYKVRQYEFSLVGGSNLVLMDAEEDVDLLR